MTLIDLLREWEAAKLDLSDTLHLSRDLLHVHVGLAVYALGCLLLREPIGSRRPVLIVLALELVNELVDFIRFQVGGWPWTPADTVADIVNTLLWPVALTLLARRRLAQTA